MPADKETQRHIHSVQTATSRDGPLTSAEEAVLDRLLQRKVETLPAAVSRKEQEIIERKRLEKKRAKMAAREEKLAMELRELQLSIDRVTDELSERLSNTARRDVVGRLEAFYDLNSKFIKDGMPLPSRAAVRAFAELCATPHLQPREKPLRQRLSEEAPKTTSGTRLTVDEMVNDPKIVAAAILAAGRRRRGEIE